MLIKIGMLVLFSTLIAGCSTPGPQLLRGSYYWTGDSSCESSSYRTDTSINCYNSDEEATGYRNAMTNQEMQAYKYEQQRKQQEISQAIKQFSEGLAELNRKTTNAYSYKPPTSSYNSYMPSNEPSGYRSSTGRTYQYDLSNPRDRARYRADPRARLRDRIEPDVLRRNDQNMGQYGGGILNNNKGAQW